MRRRDFSEDAKSSIPLFAGLAVFLILPFLLMVGGDRFADADYMAQPVMTARVDPITGAAITMEYEHHGIHEGDMFTVSYSGVGAGAGEETAISFTTPAAATYGRVHMIVEASASEESVFEIREGPTINLNQGAAVVVLNRYRGKERADGNLKLGGMLSSSAVPTPGTVSTYNVAQAAAGDLAVGAGDVIHTETLAVAAAPPLGSISNSLNRGQREWILEPEFDYVIILTQSGAGAAAHQFTLNWYEHVDSEFIN